MPPPGRRAGRRRARERHRHLRAVEAESRAGSGGLRRRGALVGALLGECCGEDRLAGDHCGEPALLLRLRPEAGDRHRAADDRRNQRDGDDAAALLLEQQAGVDEAAAAAAAVLGKGRAEQSRLGEGRPHLGIVAVAARLDFLQAVACPVVGEDLRGQFGDRLLLVGKGEIHARCSCSSSVPRLFGPRSRRDRGAGRRPRTSAAPASRGRRARSGRAASRSCRRRR